MKHTIHYLSFSKLLENVQMIKVTSFEDVTFKISDFFLHFYCGHYYRCPHPSPFAYLHSSPTPLPSSHHRTIVCVHGSCIPVLWLIPSPSFIQSLHPPPLWLVSVSSMCPCLCFCFVH